MTLLEMNKELRSFVHGAEMEATWFVVTFARELFVNIVLKETWGNPSLKRFWNPQRMLSGNAFTVTGTRSAFIYHNVQLC